MNNDSNLSKVPDWAKSAVWYQVFVERFRNGNPAGNPRKEDLCGAYPDEIPDNWAITPWGQDWYRPDNYVESSGIIHYWDQLQMRRYGGDLQGVLDKLDYLTDLGINAIYFNPLNDAPSAHKYDPRCWHHIDRNFGPDPEGDACLMAKENPLDPSTWSFTAADQLFLEVLRQCKLRGIRVIMDFSFNHTGKEFWAFKKVQAEGRQSALSSWYALDEPPPENAEETTISYKGWLGIKYMPEIRKVIVGQDHVFPFEGTLASPGLRQHIYAVARRWLDPDGDGDPSDGVDGFRLDVAAEVPLGFWRKFRRKVRSVNPEALLVGEVWWQEWPDRLMDPKVFLEGDIFDAIMNYRWYRPARHFFASAPDPLPPSAFVRELESIREGIRPACNQAMMNLTASHDSPRTATSLFNRGKYKYLVKPNENPAYRIDKPDDHTRAIQKMLLIHQYSYIGAPHIWYGDELGMWGSDDPDCRKPMVWPDIEFEPETLHPLGQGRKVDPVAPDWELFHFYKQLIRIRKNRSVLVNGELTFIVVDDDRSILAYSRHLEEQEVLAVFNRSESEQDVSIPVRQHQRYRDLMDQDAVYYPVEGRLRITLTGRTAILLENEFIG